MNEKDLLFLGIGGLAVWAFLKMRGDNEGVPVVTETVIVNPQNAKGTTTQQAKVGGNPKTEEQPIISTNNAQQPPTIYETMTK